tara:strand:+ start:1395 stop:1580 length:186 start_codon:yes stop_codon:yes gene_type:complete
MRVVTCLLVDIVETTIRSGAITLEPTRLTGLLWFQDSDLRLNSVGPKFVDDVDKLLRGVHG